MLAGGRTNVRKLYHETEAGQKIGYVDYTSLYPYINKYGKYPIGHAQVITQDFEPLEDEPYFGLIKVCTTILFAYFQLYIFSAGSCLRPNCSILCCPAELAGSCCSASAIPVVCSEALTSVTTMRMTDHSLAPGPLVSCTKRWRWATGMLNIFWGDDWPPMNIAGVMIDFNHHHHLQVLVASMLTYFQDGENP